VTQGPITVAHMEIDGTWVYEEVAEAGRRLLRRRQKWWEQNRVALQVTVLCMTTLLTIGVLFAGFDARFGVITPAVVVVTIGLVVFGLITGMSRFLGLVRTDYLAVVRIGCRVQGGIPAMPATLLDVGGPLRGEMKNFLAEAGLDEREMECFSVLRDGWTGNVAELISTARSLSRETAAAN